MEPHSGLNNLDYIVLGIILASGLLALLRGFVRELFSLASWIGAYFAAVHYYGLLVPRMQHTIKNEKMANWAAMGATYFFALLLLTILGALIAHFLIRGRALTAVDRSLGFLYGVGRGLIVVGLVYLAAVMALWPDLDNPPAMSASAELDSANPAARDHNEPPEWLAHARTRPLLAFAAHRLEPLVPKSMIDKTLDDYTAQKKDAQKVLEQKTLDMLSTPVPPGEAAQPEKGNTP